MKTKPTKTKEIPFQNVLTQLFNEDEPVHIALLFRLSDMPQTNFEQFQHQWPAVAETRRQVIARHLADISEENFVVEFSPVFLFLLKDPSPAVRLAALDGLWDSENLAIIEPTIQLMIGDKEPTIQAAAASTLGHIVLMGEWGQITPRAKDKVVNALLNKYDQPKIHPRVRQAVLESLGGASHPRSATIINQAYDSDDKELQISAIYAMGQSTDKRWLSTVLQEMDNSWPEMRAEAAKAAGYIGHSDGVERLSDLLYDDDLEVRLAAITALGQIGSEAAYHHLRRLADDPHLEDNEALAEALEEALEEMDWLSGEVNLSLLEWDDEEEDEF